MASVVIALGSNLNDPHAQLRKAAAFLEKLSDSPIQKSAIYRSEPVGPSDKEFLNAAVLLDTDLPPAALLEELKQQEKRQGRPSRYPKWTARTLDLDIISYDHLVIETDTLIIPHQDYKERLFVLHPLKDVLPDWKDPSDAQRIDDLIRQSPEMHIERTRLEW